MAGRLVSVAMTQPREPGEQLPLQHSHTAPPSRMSQGGTDSYKKAEKNSLAATGQWHTCVEKEEAAIAEQPVSSLGSPDCLFKKPGKQSCTYAKAGSALHPPASSTSDKA